MVLGKGTYRVQVQYKPSVSLDGSISTPTIGELVTTRIFWNRVLDETSTASVNVPLTGKFGKSCCEILKNVIPVACELVIYRNDAIVWVGPITRMTSTGEELTIQASDLSWWLERRVPRINHNWQQIDLSTMFGTLIEEALALDDFHMLYEVNESGILGDREIKVNEYKYFGETLRELGRTGIDWTVFLRKMYAGGYTVPNATPIATLRTDHFSNGYDVTIQGDIMCSNAIVKGSGEASTAEFGGSTTQYGLIDQVVNESTIEDYNSALVAAQSRYAMFKKPPLFIANPNKKQKISVESELDDTSSAILSAEAPVDIQSLIPGATVAMSVDYLCELIEFQLRLKRVSVTVENNENVELGLIPVGTTGAGN